jgi:hypothetical protein
VRKAPPNSWPERNGDVRVAACAFQQSRHRTDANRPRASDQGLELDQRELRLTLDGFDAVSYWADKPFKKWVVDVGF